MSQHIAEVVGVNLEKHDNADALSIVRVKGWQCVVKTDDFKDIKLGVYIPLDCVVPDTDEWKWLENRRIKTHKFRGALSQGLLIPAKPGMKLGDDVTEKLGITRYVPKTPGNKGGLRGGYTVPTPAGMEKYTDIENYKNYTNIFSENDTVVVTEKIHGANARFALIDGVFYVGSHNTVRMPIKPEPVKSIPKFILKLKRKLGFAPPRRFPDAWQIVADKYKIEDCMRERFRNKNVVLYGEIYGPKIQNLTYGVPAGEVHVKFFDILIDGAYQDWATLRSNLIAMGLQSVPSLKVCPFSKEVLKMADGKSFAGDHIREGIVVRPWLAEEYHPKLGRKIIKVISDKYLLKDIEEEPEE